MSDHDPVNRPKHYAGNGTFEAIDVIEAFGLSYHLGNVIKYVLRHRLKGGAEDLKKARWYLDREIERGGGDVVVEAVDLPATMTREQLLNHGDDASPRSQLDRIVEAIRGGAITATDVAIRTGLSQAAVSRQLSDLSRAGRVVRLDRGRYRVP